MKNDPAIFALAMAAGAGDEATRQAALEALPVGCRTATHLFSSFRSVEDFRAWGRSLRRAVGAGNPRLEVSDEHARLFEWIVRGGGTESAPRHGAPSHCRVSRRCYCGAVGCGASLPSLPGESALRGA